MNFKEFETSDKLRGGFYTPDKICNFIVKFITKNKPESILEPSFGDGNFINSLLKIKKQIKITGIEINKKEFLKVKKKKNLNLLNKNFLEWYLDKPQSFDAIVGNPPFVRYQFLDNSDQKLIEHIFNKFQLKHTMHTNLWVPFVIASIDLLKPGGSLGMVIPNEILNLPHAKSLRSFVKLKLEKLLILDSTKLMFEKTLQGTSIILARKKKDIQKKSLISIKRYNDFNFLNNCPSKIWNSAKFNNITDENKWMKFLLSSNEIKALEKIKKNKFFFKFNDVASVDVGIVTGANDFFLYNEKIKKEYNLEKYSKPIFGRSSHCKGLIYDKKNHNNNKANNLPINFLKLSKDLKINKGLKKYLQLGESQNLHKRYKCRIRKPWFVVPSVYSTKLGLLKRCHFFPRLILNSYNAYTTDTAYRIKSKSKDEISLSYFFINSVTALSAELEGRSYGGGVLELTPSEIERLTIPFVKINENQLKKLNKELLVNNNEKKILKNQDKIISELTGAKLSDLKIINSAYEKLLFRRIRLNG